ncbi:hypothetical protein [Vulcaniibacterium tengchongense]|uniref:DUF4440 domain-containing protein n=1 Tax=Vulcaniibacterium tengchongense TaxID=1273429 RepID=A0A3N4VB67_9GAMM|nr:hypothetical protein [Vulcaniibacterium tengchongense]RPE80232.1 hypothetical protein EDC50_2064 [Vulcaniibacterium tengchongense]
MRLPLIAAALLGLLLVAGPAAASRKSDALERNQYAWSGAIRWGDFEGALNLIDPAYRQAHPVTELELERYRQVQITAYRDRGASADMKAGEAVREIEIGVVNRHTQAERTVRYREQWRWDPEARTWWLTSGLPDLWDGR